MRWIAAALAAVLLWLPVPAPSQAAPVDPFRGLGAWVDIFDDAAWAAPETTVADLRARGVDTLYLQTTNPKYRGPIRYPDGTSRFLDAAHANGMRVIGWYVPDFHRLKRDLRWSKAAIAFRSATGRRFDGFALDIEITKVADHAERGRRLVRLSRQLRSAVGRGYPLGAIIPSILVPSERGGEIHPGYWSDFPYGGIAPFYDAILPMAYWSYRTDGEAKTYAFIGRSIQLIRERSGRPDIPIHVIGGIANEVGAAEMRGFARAVRAGRAVGASMYDAATSGAGVWRALKDLKPHLGGPPAPPPAAPAPTVVALPPPPGLWSLDPTATTLEGGARVTFTFPSGGAARWVVVRGYDLSLGEIRVRLNGRRAGVLAPTQPGVWGGVQRLPLAGVGPKKNRITFESAFNPPGTDPWGVHVLGTAALGPT